jgi:2-C-methyl-D-erythritol 4-phosphate cytidylyltransferase / 2-C-methyl-D-erythritol 2,4-cyclodiphosphate synthase
MNLFLILLAAGESKRLKSNIPKTYQNVNNKMLIEHALNAFKDIEEIKKTVVVYNKKHQKYLKQVSLKNIIKISGGKTRQESTFKALKKIKKMGCTKVLIHDAARPNPPKKIIKNLIYKLKTKDAVIPAIQATDATKRTNKNVIFKNIEKGSLRLAQTPQGFSFKKIYKKHLQNSKYSFDDDSSLFTNDNEKVFIIKGSKKNIKITDKEDLEIFKSLNCVKQYTGIGFDVHRLVPNKKLYLGGLQIKSKLGTLGHSDGDPVLHAIIDAILGAARMGDIGEKFSNKSKKFKNIRSTILLKNILNEIKSKNYSINNIDINIITQTPKIQKYKLQMLKIISKLCNVEINKINIKGKTTEKLGIIGKEKAISAEVMVSLNRYD